MGRTDSVADTWGTIDPIILVIGVVASVLIGWLYIRAHRPPWTQPLSGEDQPLAITVAQPPRRAPKPRPKAKVMVLCLRPECGHAMFDQWPKNMVTVEWGLIKGTCPHCKGFGQFEVRDLDG